MPYYHKLGQLPAKRHVQFRRPDGALYSEEVFGTEGFVGPTSTLYHIHPPTQVTGWKALYSTEVDYVETNTMRMRHLKTAKMTPTGDPVTGRIVLFGNADCEMAICVPNELMNYHYKNAMGDECLFVHYGSGTVYTAFGTLTFGPKDYIIIPKGTIYRMVFDETKPGDPNPRFLVIETANGSHIVPPPRYLSKKTSQFLEHAPYCERDLRLPQLPLTYDESGDFEVRIKALSSVHSYHYEYHPLDIVGWDGCYYPYIFNIDDFSPIVGKHHLPPPTHQTFEAHNFVICSFCPRVLDFHPDAIPVPYNHSNLDSDEVLYYVEGDYKARKGIEVASITAHPQGIPHGPHPGTVEASLGQTYTDELAVMCDTFRPLFPTRAAVKLDDEAYPASWKGEHFPKSVGSHGTNGAPQDICVSPVDHLRIVIRRRQRLIVFGIVAMAVAGREAYWWVTASSESVSDWRTALETLMAVGQAPGENGYPHLVRAIEAAAEVTKEVQGAHTGEPPERAGGLVGYPDFAGVLRADIEPAVLDVERSTLDRLEAAGVYAALDALAASPRVSRPLPPGHDPFMVTLDDFNFGDARQLARALLARMRLAAIDGDDGTRARALEQTLVLGHSIGRQPTMLERLVGGAIIAAALSEVRAEIGDGLYRRPGVARAHLDIVTRWTQLPPLSRVFEAERIGHMMLIDWSFTDDGHGDGRLDIARLGYLTSWSTDRTAAPPSPLPQRVASFLFTGKTQTRDRLNAAFDDLVEQVDEPVAVRQANGFTPDALAMSLTFRDVFLKMITPSSSSMIRGNDQILGTIEATRLMLAIEAYRVDHDELPTDLDRLVPEYFAALPRDPFNGGSFVLHRAAGDGYEVISTGVDGVDDSAGGEDIALTSERESGAGLMEGTDVLYDTIRE